MKQTWTKSDFFVVTVQIGLSVVFLYLVKKVLPMRYWLIVVALLVLAGVYVFRKVAKLAKSISNSKRRKLREYRIRKKKLVKGFSCFISVILFIGSVVAGQGLGTLDQIAGSLVQTQVISVVVRNESSYEQLQDLEGQTLGVVQAVDQENTAAALKEIEAEVMVSQNEYSSVIDMAAALMNGNVESILLSEAQRGIIEDENGAFTTETRVIYEYKVRQKLSLVDSGVKVTKESFNIYLSGIDTYGEISSVSRSDVNMVVTVNPKTKQILMTSVPRDYYVELASYGVKDKLTHAGIYGVEESMKTLENLLGIEIDYYARVNFTSLINIVDALGGITVYNDQAFTSYHTYDYYPVGEIEMDGECALEFVRERYGLANGDNDRVKNQQKVLKALIDKAISPAIITNYNDILDAASGSFATSMSSKEIQKIIQMQLKDMSPWSVEQVSVSGTGSSSSTCYSMPGRSVYVMEPDYSSVEAATQKINEVANAK